MAKTVEKDLLYKIEGLKRMIKRKQLRQRKNRIKTLNRIKLRDADNCDEPWY
jgi:hypothetical protein